MSKKRDDNKILIPEFYAHRKVECTIPWTEKNDCLVWRGRGFAKKRVFLCQLSERYPDLIDAGFTRKVPGVLKRYQKNPLCPEEMCAYKYQICLNRPSKWKFFTGSPVLKPESRYTQWYFKGLEAGVNYVPVKHDLSDLIETLVDLRENGDLAEQIGQNGLQFARETFSKEATLEYLHDLLWAYSYLPKRHCTCPVP